MVTIAHYFWTMVGSLNQSYPHCLKWVEKCNFGMYCFMWFRIQVEQIGLRGNFSLCYGIAILVHNLFSLISVFWHEGISTPVHSIFYSFTMYYQPGEQLNFMDGENVWFLQVKHFILNDKLWHPPGKTRYSDLSMIVLGWIVEKVSRRPLDAFIQEHLFKPVRTFPTAFLSIPYNTCFFVMKIFE